jgi:hypothetical protein
MVCRAMVNNTLRVKDIASDALGDGHEQVDVESYSGNPNGCVQLVCGGEELVRAMTVAMVVSMTALLLRSGGRHEGGYRRKCVGAERCSGRPTRVRPSVVVQGGVHTDRGRIQRSGRSDAAIMCTVQPQGDSQS